MIQNNFASDAFDYELRIMKKEVYLGFKNFIDIGSLTQNANYKDMGHGVYFEKFLNHSGNIFPILSGDLLNTLNNSISSFYGVEKGEVAIIRLSANHRIMRMHTTASSRKEYQKNNGNFNSNNCKLDKNGLTTFTLNDPYTVKEAIDFIKNYNFIFIANDSAIYIKEELTPYMRILEDNEHLKNVCYFNNGTIKSIYKKETNSPTSHNDLEVGVLFKTDFRNRLRFKKNCSFLRKTGFYFNYNHNDKTEFISEHKYNLFIVKDHITEEQTLLIINMLELKISLLPVGDITDITAVNAVNTSNVLAYLSNDNATITNILNYYRLCGEDRVKGRGVYRTD